jgi:ribosomal protein S17
MAKRELKSLVKYVADKSLNLFPYQMAIGQVTARKDATTRQVKVIDMELNEYLKMYFNKSYELDTYDANDATRKGDIVLINRSLKPVSTSKPYIIEKVLFKVDDIIDPVTGRKFSHDDELVKKHFEKLIKSSGESIPN